MARAIYPVHAPTDGDVVFAAATGNKPVDPLFGLTELGMVAANVVARSIARGVYHAAALRFPGAFQSHVCRHFDPTSRINVGTSYSIGRRSPSAERTRAQDSHTRGLDSGEPLRSSAFLRAPPMPLAALRAHR